MSFVTRRNFLISLATTIILSRVSAGTKKKTAKKIKNEKHEKLIILNAPYGAYGNSNQFVVSDPGSLRSFDLVNKKMTEVPITFFGHTAAHDPENPDLVVTFEQYGMRGALIDLKSKKVLQTVNTAKGNTFMGHAVFLKGQNQILTTEHNHSQTRGEIVVRNAKTLEEVRRFSSNGIKPHDCALAENDKVLIVANAGRKSNISYIEVATGKVISKIQLIDDDKGPFSHFEISKDGWMIVGPRRDTARVNLVSPEKEVFTLDHPKTNKPGVLSLAFIDSTDLVLATYPEANLVQIWNYKTKKVFDTLSFPTPKGVIVDMNSTAENPSVYISLENEKTLKKIVIENGKKAKIVSTDFDFGGTGSHLTRTIS
ncbi:DUF1513 domain-containing protein [bacterium]|nr:DUF1513 domain-containing protein [bacterium]